MLFSGQEKRTPAEWKERLSREQTPVTLDEYVAGVLIRMAGGILDQSQASQHIEGMLGAIDESFSRHDDGYAGSAKIREALHQQRLALTASLRTNGQAHDPA